MKAEGTAAPLPVCCFYAKVQPLGSAPSCAGDSQGHLPGAVPQAAIPGTGQAVRAAGELPAPRAHPAQAGAGADQDAGRRGPP